MSRNWKIAKIDINFAKEMKDIAKERYLKGLDKKERGLARMTKAITRLPNWNKEIKETIKKAEFIKDTSGQFTAFNIFSFMIIIFIAVIIFAGIIWVTGMLNGVFHQVGQANEVNAGQVGYVNMTKASDDTFGQLNSGVGALRLVAIVLIFGYIVSIIVTNALVKVHPLFFFAYVLITLLAVILSAPISNAYENILMSNVFDGTLASFTGANWMMLKLPIVVTVLGLLGGVFMFINIIRTGNEEQLR